MLAAFCVQIVIEKVTKLLFDGLLIIDIYYMLYNLCYILFFESGVITMQTVSQSEISSTLYIHKKRIYADVLKRPLDLFFSIIAIILLLPVYLVLAVLVFLNLGSPVIFKQERTGKDGKHFNMYKFRSMTDKRDEAGNLLPDKVRLTTFGKWLRATSLDELPQFINVVMGHMSLVGPRPQVVKFEKLYNEHQWRRHEVRPGLTGLAQVSGRNGISWDMKFDLDVKYVDTVSLLGDVKIFMKTFGIVFKKEGISQKGMATVEEFRGSTVHAEMAS